ncbi:MAG: sigma-70 family RNA polymerase sigma factor [Eubacteriales bacterium]
MSLTLELLPAAQEGDEKATTKILEENTGLIWSVIRRYYGRGVESDDLYQLGCLGFLKAVRGFDPEFGTQFSTYAVPKIAGEVRRFLRDDGAVKVSRTLKEQALTVKMARGRLITHLGREPTLSELSEETGFTPEDIAAAETATEAVTSLQAETGEGLTLESLLTLGNQEEQTLEKIALRTAIGTLPDNQQEVLLLRYFKGMTQSAAAKVLGISQVQVSRLERRAIGVLREVLEE